MRTDTWQDQADFNVEYLFCQLKMGPGHVAPLLPLLLTRSLLVLAIL